MDTSIRKRSTTRKRSSKDLLVDASDNDSIYVVSSGIDNNFSSNPTIYEIALKSLQSIRHALTRGLESLIHRYPYPNRLKIKQILLILVVVSTIGFPGHAYFRSIRMGVYRRLIQRTKDLINMKSEEAESIDKYRRVWAGEEVIQQQQNILSVSRRSRLRHSIGLMEEVSIPHTAISLNARERDMTTTGMISTVDIAIAFCSTDLNWMYKDVIDQIHAIGSTYHPNDDDIVEDERKGSPIKINITVFSKCGNEHISDKANFHNDKRVDSYKVVTLPNVGGCDYAHAHYLMGHIEKIKAMDDAIINPETNSTILLLIKDTPRIKAHFNFPFHERFREVKEMMDLASKGEFICGVKWQCNVSPYHNTKTIGKFVIKNYIRQSELIRLGSDRADHSEIIQPQFNPFKYKNLEDFHKRALKWTFPNEKLAQVCYGGTFALPLSQLVGLSKDPAMSQALELLKTVLARDTHVAIEEHFAERTWAGLLANPLTDEQTEALIQIANQSEICRIGSGICGAMQYTGNDMCQ